MLKVPILAAVLAVGTAAATPAAVPVDVSSQYGCDAATQPWLPRTLKDGAWMRSVGHVASDQRLERASTRIGCTVV